jgi:hypothetical protein
VVLFFYRKRDSISYAKTLLQVQGCRLTVLDELVGGDIANGDTGHFGGCEGGCRRWEGL